VSGSHCRYAIAIPLAVLVVGTILAWTTRIDLRVEDFFFYPASGGWPVGKTFFFDLAYRYGDLSGWIPAILALGALVASIWVALFVKWRRACVFLMLFLAIGPGLMVNVVFKDYWGRPRPRQIEQFGGKYAYQHPLVIGERGDGRVSFPSGHAAMGFYFIGPYFILLAKHRRAALWWLWGGVAFGLFIGSARMAQGAHWPSDILWSFGVDYIVAYALARALHLDSMEENEQPT
jgi:lipid A 4'-phosphatase